MASENQGCSGVGSESHPGERGQAILKAVELEINFQQKAHIDLEIAIVDQEVCLIRRYQQIFQQSRQVQIKNTIVQKGNIIFQPQRITLQTTHLDLRTARRCVIRIRSLP